jgi:hypothetical protein
MEMEECDKRIGICYFKLRCHRYSLLSAKTKRIFHSKIPHGKRLQFTPHRQHVQRKNTISSSPARFIYIFHFFSLKFRRAFDLRALHLLQSQVLFNSSLSNSRILSIYLFGYWEIPSFLFFKFRKFERKMAV